MAAGGDVTIFQDAALYLAAAVVAVPIFKRLKLGSVLGYLAAGAIIGPHVFAIVGNAESVLAFSEFGVVLLLFLIGLELKPARLWALKADIFGLGTAQVCVTAFLIGVFGVMVVGLSWQTAVLIGLGLSLSSTAFALQLMQERKELNTQYGTRAFSILLLQDLAIAPILALSPLLALGIYVASGEDLSWIPAAQAIGALVGLVLAGRFLLNPIFAVIAQTKSSEIFVAAALLVVIGSALLMEWCGLSMALGAFMAGVLLAESEYRHQIEADIQPFRGLLLGLFFIAIGMTIDWTVVLAQWPLVLGGAILLMAVKGVVILILCRVFKSPWEDAGRIAVTLPQGGEFGFVIVAQGLSLGLMSNGQSDIVSALITLSMALTPLLRLSFEEAMKRRAPASTDHLPRPDETETNSVVVLGFGRVGQIVSQIFRMKGISVTAIDADPKRIEAAKRFGAMVYFGDATRIDVLTAAGVGRADLVYVTIDNAAACTRSIAVIAKRFPTVRIMARAHDRVHALELLDSGADFLIRDTFESSVKLAEEGLNRLEINKEEIAHLLEEFRRVDSERLMRQKADGIYATAEDGGTFRLDKS